MLVKRDGNGLWGPASRILLLSFCFLVLSLGVGPADVQAADGDLLINGFYTYGSESEMDAAEKLDMISLTWGRIAKDWKGQIVFTSWAEPVGAKDGFPEFSTPPDPIPRLAEVKALPAEKYLMVGVMDDNNQDDNSLLIEFLNMSEKQWTDQVIDPMVKYLSSNRAGINFVGVSMDLEGLKDTLPGEALAKRYGNQNSGLKNKYTNFLRLLDEKLDEKKLTVCLQPSDGYYNGYDFKAIGQIADYVVLMAHDYHHYSPGSAAPDITASAPYFKVESAVDQAIKSGMPSKKILLAICLAAVKWTQNGSGWKSANVSLEHVDNLLKGKYGEVISAVPDSRYLEVYEWGGKAYDYRTGFVNVKYRNENQQVVNSYVYYENKSSLEEKMQLARSRMLGGISLWRLGLGNDEAWDTLLDNHVPSMFADMSSHWAKATVEELAKAGVVSGVNSNTFNPNGKITRAEFAAMLNRAMKLPQPSKQPPFKDVKSSDWFYQDVNRAYGAGIIAGRSADRFAPAEQITREEAVTMMVRALDFKGVELSDMGTAVRFVDGLSISEWAKEDVNLAAANQLVAGTPVSGGVAFKPRGLTTRAEGAVLVKRLMDKI